jgi:hypothetical protein
MSIAPRIATPIPALCLGDGASRISMAEMAATTAGWRLTRVTDAAIVVRWTDAFHAQKCSASETPPNAARIS